MLNSFAKIASIFLIAVFLPAEQFCVKGQTQQDTSVVARDSITFPQDSTLIPRDSTLVPQDSTLIPRDSTLVPQDSTLISRDSTLVPQDSTLAVSDSTAIAPTVSLSKRELRKMNRLKAKNTRDSIKVSSPRVLETYAVPDSLYYKRIIVWNTDAYFNKLNQRGLDTTMNDWFSEYPFLKEDINGTYLGTVGSATQYYNFFKRKDFETFSAFAPYMPYSYDPESMPFFNTKTAYTELAYWGTLFAYREKEESSIKFNHTQNISPALNFNILYQNYSTKGLLSNEGTKNRTFALTFNNLGKRYVMHGGYIHHRIVRSENGGVLNTADIRDTIVDGKTVPVILSEASNTLRRNTFFIKQTYSIPFNFLRKQDSLALGDGTMAFIGHIGEYSTYSRQYSDQISASDSKGREFYNNKFYINPYVSSDSTRVMRIENKLFLRLQPWAKDAIISKIDGGIGYQYLNVYDFSPQSFLSGNTNISLNNLYFYAGASGNFKKYFSWEAIGDYTFAGYNQNDFSIDAKAVFAFYPFKKDTRGIYLTARFSTSLKRPDWYQNNLYSNHYQWNNDFNKVSKTNIEGELSIPYWKMSAFFGNSLIGNNIYYDTLGVIKQSEDVINVMSAYLQKDFKLWHFHLDNQILFQISSNQNELPLPLVALNLRYYFEYPLVKNVLNAQIGASATFNTKYYAPAYNPATGAFQLQVQEQLGNCPYVDVFVNLQWKKVSLFVKYTNVTLGWPEHDYFSAYRYILPQRGFKFGIHWPFYYF